MAICVIAVVGDALCQCFSPGSNQIHIARVDFLDWAVLALYQAAAHRDDEDLAEGLDVPCRASAGLKGHRVASRPRRSGRFEQGAIRTVPVNHSAGPLPEGWEPILSRPAGGPG